MLMKRLTINRIASAALRTNRKSYVALAVGIFLSIFLVTAMCLGVHGLFMASDAKQKARLGSQDAFWLSCEVSDADLMATGLYSEIGHVYIPATYKPTSSSVGYYDEKAAEYLNRSFIAGRMPERSGELAIEEGALARLRLEDVGVGDEITLTLSPVQGADEERTFTIVGVMNDQSAAMRGYTTYGSDTNHFPELLIHPDDAVFATGSMVQHKLFTFAKGVTAYQALTYYSYTDENGRTWYGDLNVFSVYDSPTSYPFELMMVDADVLMYSACIAFLVGALLLATCVGIAGAMESQLSRKTAEIGMLRAVGATKKQIRRIFGREAWLLALIVSPLAVAAGCAAAWVLSLLVPEHFLFRPTWWLLLPVLLISVMTILLSGGLPLRRASTIMPMSVMRDTDMLRRLKHIRPRENFSPARLVAWRQLSIRPTQLIAPALLMCLMLIVVSTTMYSASESIHRYAAQLLYERPGFSLYNSSGYGSGFYDYISEQQLTAGDLAQIRSLPGVKRVEIVSSIPVAQELGETVPVYWQPVYRTREHNGYTYSNNLGNGHQYLLPEEVRPENVQEMITQAGCDASRQHLGIEGHLGNSIRLNIVVIDPAEMAQHVVSGRIDLNAINAGREVLVFAPTIYSFLTEDGSINSMRGRSDAWLENRLNDPNTTLLAAIENDAYIPGQELTLHYLWTTETGYLPTNYTTDQYLAAYGQMEHVQATVTIGAVIDGGVFGGDDIVILTTEQGLANMGLPMTRVSSIEIYTDDLTLEEEEALEKRIIAIAQRGEGYEVTNLLAGNREGRQEDMMLLLLLIGVTLILMTVCIAQVSGSVSRRVRADARMIGTLRAVGADEHVIFRCYAGQVIMSVLIGAAAGLLVYWFGFCSIPYVMQFSGTAVYPAIAVQLLFIGATMGACLLLLRLRIRDVTHHSIVENIREL